MEFQGNKAITHDFLSIRKDSSLQDSRPPPQGFVLENHDFLVSGGGATRAGEDAVAPAAIDLNVAAAPAGTAERPSAAVEHVVPGCFGAYAGVRHVPRGYGSGPVPVVVKPEWPTCAAPPSPGATRADTEGGGVGVPTCNGAGRRSSCNPAGVYWREPVYVPGERAVVTSRGPHHHHHQQWHRQQPWPSPPPFPPARGGSSVGFPPFSSSSSGNQQPARDKQRPMDVASMRPNKGFPDEEEEDEEEEDFGKSEAASHKGLTVKVDGGSNNNDQKPSTPRSKHSATEQRRRSKINDRFQILRSLIPHSDQKRDKASFLLEVIEYIQFLQEKVQKYESSYPGWNHDNVKLMPWKNIQAPGECMVDPSNTMKNGPMSSGFIFPADGPIAGAPTVMLNSQNMAETENVRCDLASKSASIPIPIQYPGGTGSGYFQPQRRLIPDSDDMATPSQAQWVRSCTMDCSVSTDILSGQDDLVIDEGTISMSSMYSDGLLNTLTQALQSSGIDLSQASISVQINLGRRAISRPISSTKDQDPSSSNHVVGHSRVGSSGEESEQANKRHKSDTG